MTPLRDCPLCYHLVESNAKYCPQCSTLLLPYRRLGEILLEQGSITREQLAHAMAGQKQLGKVLVDAGFVTDNGAAEVQLPSEGRA